MDRNVFLAYCWFGLAAGFAAEPQLRPLGEPRAYKGFVFTSAAGQSIEITFGGVGNITAGKQQRVEKDGRVRLAFSALRAAPTPKLGPGSFVTVETFKDDPFPRVEFRFEIEAFDKAKWEAAMGEVPFHFLCCRQPGAEIFHQRGWTIPTPALDPYPLHNKGKGYGRQIVSRWSDDWTYAPPIGAYPVATVGLWTPSKRRYVAYDFHAARLTDHSEKDVASAYCWRFKDTGEFFALVWPYARPYQTLRYPEPSVAASHFRLLHSASMPSDADPNEFVTRFIWKRYASFMPGTPRMNDLSWLPAEFRLLTFPKPGVPRLYRRIRAEEKRRWWKPGTLVFGGVVWDGDPVTYLYETKQRAKVNRLKQDIEFLLRYAKRFQADGDACVAWRMPLEGEAIDMFGPDGVPTVHNLQTWQVGLTLLDVSRNDPALAPRLLPYVDGVLRWTKHVLFTRNGYADVPCAQFCWAAGPVTSFCLRYYYTFRNDRRRAALAKTAFRLARTMLYRYLPIWCSDNNDLDALDSSFMLEPNSGISWLGSACSNEVWVIPHAAAQVYVATGDPVLGHYLRGMLERWSELYRNEYHPTVAEYDKAFAECFGLYDGAHQAVGTRSTFGGLWGLAERYVWPVGDARARVLCGEAAAMAFDKNGKHTDIASYRSYGAGKCSFRVTRLGPPAKQDKPFALCVTYPYFDLRRLPVTLRRAGRVIQPRVQTFPQRPDSILVRGVRYGDTVAIGAYDARVKPRPCAPARPRVLLDGRDAGDFHCCAMASLCNTALPMNWDDPSSWAGFKPGRKTLFGVPFDLVDPLLNAGKVCARNSGCAIGGKATYLFLLVDGRDKTGKLELVHKSGVRERVDLKQGVPALRGWPPCFQWRIDLLALDLSNKPVRALAWDDLSVFAATLYRGDPARLRPALAAIEDARKAAEAERKATEALRALAPLFQARRGKVAVLPDAPKNKPYALPVVRALAAARLMPYVELLSPGRFVSPHDFNAERFWVAIYAGGEHYWRTVRRPGDGDEAIRRFLDGGGTLLLLARQPFPFYYDQDGEVVVAARKFGVPICGSGVGKRPDTLKGVRVNGWEKPPAGVKLTFHVCPGQSVVKSLPKTFPFPGPDDKIDLRWRPIVNWVRPGERYTPLITLRDADGKSYGEAAALVERPRGRVIYVWSSLLRMPGVKAGLLADVLAYALRAATPPPARYVCPRVDSAPRINGLLNDPVWRGVPWTSAFTRFQPVGAPARLLTKAKLCWDDENLYVAFLAQDPDIWSALARRDAHLWEGEVVELYVDPDGDGKHYKEFEVNPLNAVIDLDIAREVNGRVEHPDAYAKWNAPGLRTGVYVDGTTKNRNDRDRQWTVEMAIPWQAFPTAAHRPPRVGDVWRAQLLRIDRSKGFKPEFTAWSPTDTFHRPRRFGALAFGGPALHEDFSLYPDGEFASPTWTLLAGRWRIESGELVGEDAVADGWTGLGAAWGLPEWRDYRVSVRFRIEARGGDWRDGPWFGVRCDDAGRGLFLNFSSRDVQLHRRNQAGSTNDSNPLARAAWMPDGRWHTLVITVKGRRFTAALDGKGPFIRVDDVGPEPAAGRIVLLPRKWSKDDGSTRVRYDDLKAALDP